MSTRRYGKGECPVCHRHITLLQDRTLRRHAAKLGEVPGRVCDGWGRPAVKEEP